MGWIKRVVSLLVLLFVLRVFLRFLHESKPPAEVLHQAHWEWLPAVLVVAFASYLCITWLNILTLRPFGGDPPWHGVMGMLAAVACIEVAVPTAGASGVLLRARLLGRYGYSVEVASFTLLVETIFLCIAMASIGVVGGVYLVRHGELGTPEAVLLGLAALGLAGILWWTWQVLMDPRRGQRLALRLALGWNRRFRHRRRIDMLKLARRLKRFSAGLDELRQVPRWRLALAAYGRALLDVATLGLCFHMFGCRIHPGPLFTGYGLMLVMSGLSALPFGIAAAEMSMPVIFNRAFGIDQGTALAAYLGYRLVAFWGLRLVGYVHWQITEHRA